MTELPDALNRNAIISTWLRFKADRLTVCTGKVELGQGIATAIAMIAAEELDMPVAQVDVQTGRTDDGPQEFPTVGSMSIQGSGSAVRQVAAEARYHLLLRAAERFGIALEKLKIEDGVIAHRDGNERVSFSQLTLDDPLDIRVTGIPKPKSPDQYHVVGGSTSAKSLTPRVDLSGKINGARAFIQDLNPPGLKHARVVRPRQYEQQLVDIDASSLDTISDFHKLVVDGNFVAVVADTEFAAEQAADRLRLKWSEAPEVPTDIEAFLRGSVRHRLLVEDGIPTNNPIADEPDIPLLRATYFKPYYLHGSMAPSAALAMWQQGQLEVYSHSQGPALIRHSLAEALGIDRKQVIVIHAQNAGCYGHNGADDAAMDAALIAKHCEGSPILLKWRRADEHLQEPFSSAMLIDVAASLNASRIDYWQADVFSQTHNNRPFPVGDGSTTLLAALQKANPLPKRIPKPGYASHGGVHRNADPYYNFRQKRITKNLVTSTRIRTSSTRGLGAFANVFAIESFMDEMAHEAGVDPLTFRLTQLEDPRAIEVLNTMATALDRYHPAVAAGELTGKGMAFGRYKNTMTYAAVGVVVRVSEETLNITLDHAVIAADAGLIIDHDGLTNQLEGGVIQAASWATVESVELTQSGSASASWEQYPILRFDAVPTVDVHLINRLHEPSLGAGEATCGPTPAAIANAIFDATGVRLRSLPLTTEALKSAALQ